MAFVTSKILSPAFIWVDRAGTRCWTSTYSTTLRIRLVLWGYFGVPEAAPLCDAKTLLFGSDTLNKKKKKKRFYTFHGGWAPLEHETNQVHQEPGCYNRFICTLIHGVLCLAYIYPQVLLFIARLVCCVEVGSKTKTCLWLKGYKSETQRPGKAGRQR